MNSGKIIIGSVEWCSFPQINIPTIKARIDSGAKTSALHAINIAAFKKTTFYGLVLMFILFKMMEELLFIVKHLFLIKEELKVLAEIVNLGM
jgi:hypothetical protein